MSSKKTQVSKWVPKMGEKFWFISILSGGAAYSSGTRTPDDSMRIRVGNFYKTRQDVQAATKNINAMFAKNR